MTYRRMPSWHEPGRAVPKLSLEKFAALRPEEVPEGELRLVTLARAGCGARGLQWVLPRILPPDRYGGGCYLRVALVTDPERAPFELADAALLRHGWQVFVPWFSLEEVPAEGPWRGHRLYRGMWDAFVCRSGAVRE
ncbi:hypothetical protein [Streptomyces sp. TR02-1]|uniref:hypothetical protein n=1 Tax=Streptomyces sp. TR02-1 TaxID=3385977 RepID=UPI0039A34A88